MLQSSPVEDKTLYSTHNFKRLGSFTTPGKQQNVNSMHERLCEEALGPFERSKKNRDPTPLVLKGITKLNFDSRNGLIFEFCNQIWGFPSISTKSRLSMLNCLVVDGTYDLDDVLL